MSQKFLPRFVFFCNKIKPYNHFVPLWCCCPQYSQNKRMQYHPTPLILLAKNEKRQKQIKNRTLFVKWMASASNNFGQPFRHTGSAVLENVVRNIVSEVDEPALEAQQSCWFSLTTLGLKNAPKVLYPIEVRGLGGPFSF